jgi:hypothetical protein
VEPAIASRCTDSPLRLSMAPVKPLVVFRPSNSNSQSCSEILRGSTVDRVMYQKPKISAIAHFTSAGASDRPRLRSLGRTRLCFEPTFTTAHPAWFSRFDHRNGTLATPAYAVYQAAGWRGLKRSSKAESHLGTRWRCHPRDNLSVAS